MKHIVPNRTALAAFVLIGFLCTAAYAQQAGVRATWFDINPSQSNDGNNGGSSGRVNHVSAASDFSRVYAATEWGGLYTSSDQGSTWVRINTFAPSVTWDVKVDPRNNQRVYATSFMTVAFAAAVSQVSVSATMRVLRGGPLTFLRWTLCLVL